MGSKNAIVLVVALVCSTQALAQEPPLFTEVPVARDAAHAAPPG